MKFEGDRSNPLEVMISQTQEYEKAIRPLFTDPVTYLDEQKYYNYNVTILNCKTKSDRNIVIIIIFRALLLLYGSVHLQIHS